MQPVATAKSEFLEVLLTRNEKEFDEFLSVLSTKEPLPKTHSLTMSYMARKWKNSVFEKFSKLGEARALPQLINLKITHCNINAANIEDFFGNRLTLQSNLNNLDLSNNSLTFGCKELKALTSFNFSTLKSLSLRGNRLLSDEGANILKNTGKKAFPNLNELFLDNCSLSDVGLIALSESELANDLQLLSLSQNSELGELLIIQEALKRFRNITQINLSLCSVSSEGFQRLFNCETFSKGNNKIKHLELARNTSSGDLAAEYIASLDFRFLQYLDLSGANLTSKGLKALLTAETLENMKLLKLSQNPELFTNSENLGSLSGKLLKGLTSLFIEGSGLRMANICHIFDGKLSVSKLEELFIGDNDLGDEGFEYIIDKGNLGDLKLKTLNIRNCGITARAIEHLAKASMMSNLVKLNVRNNTMIKDQGLIAIAEGIFSQSLKQLIVTDCGVSDEGARGFIKSHASFPVLQDFRFGENEITESTINLLSGLNAFPYLRCLAVGSRIDVDSEAVATLKKRGTEVLPFFGDEDD